MTEEPNRPIGADPIGRYYHGPGGSVPWMKPREARPTTEYRAHTENVPLTVRERLVIARESLIQFLQDNRYDPERDDESNH